MSSQFTLAEIFAEWKSWSVKDYGTNRFLSKYRHAIIDELVNELIKNEIPIEEARSLRSDVNDHLVTKEGSKGKGKHKGWNENVLSDFDGAIKSLYSDEIGKPTITLRDGEYGKAPYMPKSPIITAWAQDKFGFTWNENINLLAHMYGHRFNHEFQREVLDSTWSKTGKDAPEWAKSLFSL